MADDPEQETGQETGHPDGGPGAASLSDGELARLADMVAEKLRPARAESQKAVEDRLAGPGDVAALVRAELARTDKEARDADVAQKVESHAEVLARLTEAPPAAPVRRVERIMKWAG